MWAVIAIYDTILKKNVQGLFESSAVIPYKSTWFCESFNNIYKLFFHWILNAGLSVAYMYI